MAKRRHDPDTRQLTGLLCMPCEIKLSNPSKAWLEDQTRGIGRLDKPLRRSNKLLARISSRLDRFRARPKAAQLCKAHHGLNPKLIRRHMLHIIAECTKRIDRLRLWQRRIPFPPSIKAWLQRMDAVIGMWMGAEAFGAVFGYAQVASCPKPVKSGCEACIMSVIGGRDQALLDLRASLFSRTGGYGRKSRKEPRLLRLLESWIDHFGRDRADAIRRQSEMLADTLRAVRLQEKRKKEERNNDTRSSKSSRHPVSRAESVTKKVEQEVIAKNRGLPRQGASGWAQNTDGQLDYAYFQSPPSSWGALDEESNEEHPESDSVQEAQSSDLDELDTPDELAGFEASNWMDMRMKSQGLAPNERQKLFQDDTHPVLSDYGPASAVTSALRPPRAMYSGSESGRRPQPNLNRPAPSAGPSTSMAGGSIWEAVSVASLSESGSHVPSYSTSAMAPPSTMSTISSLAPNLSARRKAPGTQNAPSLVSLPPDDQPYLDFCKAMGLEVRLDLLKNQRAAAPSGLGSQPSDEGGDILPPPSSIYSQD
ncbi:hypothetical protein B0J15DRAFT_573761 [Fusarium solani]|uniref:Uncharacterized protein n=1 Tax=Fusarium solani TaxID=169388 RepID=A0A9P9L2R5_FUSSL|nr:uncharacterized protein B0J15DRAFT_573761 [Fusarium solani]KAH7272921.1 hypothetical protein B0J15DRAFT_573761 [Fusarium solani]